MIIFASLNNLLKTGVQYRINRIKLWPSLKVRITYGFEGRESTEIQQKGFSVAKGFFSAARFI
jgi:hypothetical protein